MSKMGSREPFGHLQHKLWQKERPDVELVVWIPTTKSQELIQPRCVQAECNMPLESSWPGLQLCFRPHCDWRSAQEIILPQNCKRPSCRHSHLGAPGQKAIWMWHLWRVVEYIIWRKVLASSKFGPWWVLWIQSRPWLVLVARVLQEVN
jgi:hypothetical protein